MWELNQRKEHFRTVLSQATIQLPSSPWPFSLHIQWRGAASPYCLASHCTRMLRCCYRSSPCLRKGLARVKYTKDCRANTEALYLHIINQNLDHLTQPSATQKWKKEPIKLKIRQFNKTEYAQVMHSNYPDTEIKQKVRAQLCPQLIQLHYSQAC